MRLVVEVEGSPDLSRNETISHTVVIWASCGEWHPKVTASGPASTTPRAQPWGKSCCANDPPHRPLYFSWAWSILNSLSRRCPP